MEQEILKMAISQGLGYVLFVWLLMYVLKTTDAREKKYQDVITALTDKLNIVDDVKKDVEENKNKIK
ncbi:BhlA/UviB family holin-like peptide [Clostridium tyrobutyricum]|jgi:hypothetical protein|uniref:BhlA/UviB family holin-like peptide n=1 Tax=Clostridium tyrobutyricum TaxID=1519 RepID=UPI000E999922|nr:BhlA/UviB family holin-like peptide [Clostridium tyrobutyricum]HBN28378.1 UviB-like protein [Clostridiaceae bacterium]